LTKFKVLAVDVLDGIYLEFIQSKQINKIVCNESKLRQPIDNVEIINAEIYRVEGTWQAYRFNESILNSLWNKASRHLKIDGIDVRPSAAKLMFWTNYRIGAIKHCLETNFKGHEIYDLTSYTYGSKLRGLLKYFKLFYDNNFKGKTNTIEDNQAFSNSGESIGILVNNDFELLLYQYIIEELKSEKIIVFHYGEISKDIKFHIRENITLINLSKISYTPKQSFFIPFNLSKDELYMVNLMYQNWHNLGSEIHRFTYIKSTGIKKILINVGENLPFRNLMKPIFGDDIKVVNTMNGIKAGEAHDADINFDQWYVWDKELKQLLVDKCFIPEEKLIVTGHLAEDHIRYHKFENSIQIDLNIIKEKKVISVFSVRGMRKEKVDLFKLLYELIQKREDVTIIIKPHPLEKMEDYIRPDFETQNVIFIDESLKNSKPALYDLLHISDLSIVFGSTVALECSWIKTPCITFEYKSTSLIHTLESDFIEHISKLSELEEHLKTLKKKKSIQNTGGNDKVSERIVKNLKNLKN